MKGSTQAWIALIIFAIFGIVADVIFVPHLLKKTVEAEEVIMDGDMPKNGDYVTIKVDTVIDPYIETTNTKNGVKTSANQGYMVLLDDNTVLSLTFSEKNLDKINKLCDEFWDYYDGKTDDYPSKVTFSGKFRKLPSDNRSYYDNALKDYGLTEANGFNVIYYDINTMSSRTTDLIIVIIGNIIILVCVIVIIVTAKKNQNPYGTGTAF